MQAVDNTETAEPKTVFLGAFLRPSVWLVVFGLILVFGWFKSTENRRDRMRYEDWRDEHDAISAEAQKEFRVITNWFRTLRSTGAGAEDVVVKRMAGAKSLPVGEDEDEYDSYEWETRRTGIRVRASFHEGKLVTHGLNYSSQGLLRVHPQPPVVRYDSLAEKVRGWIAHIAYLPWLALIPVVIFIRRFRLVVAETMFLLSLATGMSIAVAPHYSITVQGVFSNDALFGGLVMYVISLIVLGWAHATTEGWRVEPRWQFRLSTLLAIMCLVGVLLGVGPFGYFALAALTIGGLFYLAAYFVSRPLAPPPPDVVDSALHSPGS